MVGIVGVGIICAADDDDDVGSAGREEGIMTIINR